MKKVWLLALSVALVFSLAAPLFATGQGEELSADGGIPEMKIRWASPFGATVISTKMFYRFEELVTKKTDGKITWDNYPGGALLDVTNVMHGVRDGIADMGCSVIFDRAAQPLTNSCVRAVHLTDDIMATVYGIREMGDYAPIYDEFRANNVWPVMWTSAEENVIFSTKPIHNLEDLSKMRIRANESAGFAFSLTGASVVSMPSGELYDGLQRGTIDAVAIPYNLAVSLHLYEVAPYVCDSGLGVHLTFPYIINYELWEKFPQELKDIFVECAKIAEDETVLITNAANAENVDIVVGHGYTKCYDVGQDELAKWKSLMQPATNNVILDAAVKAGKTDAAEAQKLYFSLVKKNEGVCPNAYENPFYSQLDKQ